MILASELITGQVRRRCLFVPILTFLVSVEEHLPITRLTFKSFFLLLVQNKKVQILKHAGTLFDLFNFNLLIKILGFNSGLAKQCPVNISIQALNCGFPPNFKP